MCMYKYMYVCIYIYIYIHTCIICVTIISGISSSSPRPTTRGADDHLDVRSSALELQKGAQG